MIKPAFIYFDLDNTLLDHSAAEAQALQEVYNSWPEFQAVSPAQWVAVYKEVNHRLWEQYQNGEIDRYILQESRFRDSMARLGLSAARSEQIGKQYMLRYREFWGWLDGAMEAFQQIRKVFPVGIITNGFRETQQKKIEQLKLGSYCDAVIISEDVGHLKPHPKVFDVATEKAGVKREDILYVGDSYTSDILGGRNAGWKTAWYTGLNMSEKDGEAADFRFDRFTVLTQLLNVNGDPLKL